MRRKLQGLLSAGALLASHATAFASAGGGGGVHFVDMEPLSVPIVDADRIDGVLNVTMVLDAADDAAAERISHEMPRLRFAANSASLEFARLNASGFRPVDAELLAKDLTAALQAEEPGIARVLIVEVSAENR